MAGFLDNKSRVMDVILTDVGRDQMNRGEFNVAYVTFSDHGVDYQQITEGVAKDISDHLYFEAYSSPNDEIIPEINNEGNFTLTKKVTPTLTVNNGLLYELTTTGYQQVDAFTNISDFLKLTTSRFAELQTLRTTSPIDSFVVSRNSVDMKHPPRVEFPAKVDGLNPILIDQRFAGNLNTKFLPPITYKDDGIQPLFAYNRYTKDYTLDNALEEIKTKSWDNKRIEIGKLDTFSDHNILGQFFVKREQTLLKLLVVDAGEFVDDDNVPVVQIYHLGLIYKDELGISKFSRAFSLVFHNLEE